MELQDEFKTHVLRLNLAVPEHQELNGQVKATWRTFSLIANSLMVHSRVLRDYINLMLMYTEDHILQVLQIKELINKDGEPTTP